MENVSSGDSMGGEKKAYVNVRFKKPRPLIIVIALVIILVILALIFGKSYFVAATVNGATISRSSFVAELEKQGGKQVLEGMIREKLIETELNKQKVTVTSEEVDAEIKKIEEGVISQGGTLKEALEMQGQTLEGLREQITIQKRVEKLLADKAVVTEAEIDAYIKDSKATPPKDVKMEDFRKEIAEQLKGQKFQTEAQKWITELTTNAKIKYYVEY